MAIVSEMEHTILLHVQTFHPTGGISIARIRRVVERRINLQINLERRMPPPPQMNRPPSARPSAANNGTCNALSAVARRLGILGIPEAEVIGVGMHNHRAAPQVLRP